MPTLRTFLLAAGALGLWGVLWSCGYTPADYPVRLAVRTFGETVPASYRGMRRTEGWIYRFDFQVADGTKVAVTTPESVIKTPAAHTLKALRFGGTRVYRSAAGFPFTLWDHFVSLLLVLVGLRLFVPGFLSRLPLISPNAALRLPATVLKAADAAAVAVAVLGPFLYPATQAWLTLALWAAVRWARLAGRVEFVEFAPPKEVPRIALPPAAEPPARLAKPLARKMAMPAFLSHKTREGWSRLPAGAGALGLFLVAAVNARNHLILVPVPGYRPFGLPLTAWNALGWGLLALAAVLKAREYAAAWKRDAS